MNTTSESLLFRLQSCDADQPDQVAWKQFVKLYTPLIFYWARRMGLGTADASDLVQDVLTLVFQKLPSFRYDVTGSFRGWLRTLTLNKYRETRRRKSAAQQPASESMLEQLASYERAESTWDIDYARLLVAQSMELKRGDFSPATWNALRMVMSGAKSVDEAAEEVGISPWTIYSARSRLMKRLREELGDLL